MRNLPATSHATAAGLLVVALACGAAGCLQDPGATGPHRQGADAFVSPPPGGALFGGRGTPAVPGGNPDTTPGAAPGAARQVEEADIYRLSGTTLFVANAYRGLQVVDIADPVHPQLLARVPVIGTPVDLYVRGTVVFLTVNDYFGYVWAADTATASPRRGSRLFAVETADPRAPRILAELPIEGRLEQTRLVGDVLYSVSRMYGWYDWFAPSSDSVFVASFDVADPSHPRPVDRLELPAAGWDTHAHVTAERITLSFSGWDLDGSGSWGPTTRFRAVDISDPSGALLAGAEFASPGQVRDRWGMDLDPATGTFRAVLAAGWNGGAALQVWSSPTAAEAQPLARLAIAGTETLTASRFDGARVYAVTALAVDPLFVVDLSDPARPQLAGQVVMPGQLDFIEPRGDRLVALGHTNEAGQPFQLAVSLFDVADPAAPALLSRVVFGASWSWLPVRPDDLRKAFLVFDPPPAGIGLVLVPVNGWDPATWSQVGGVQLVDYGRAALALRGFLAHPGFLQRAFPIDAGGSRLAALSDQALQTVDAADRGAPFELGRIDLARSVSALALLGGTTAAVQLAGDWSLGDTELVVTSAADPDAPAPLARVKVGAPGARMFADGSVVWLLARGGAQDKSWLQAVDFADPLQPVLRGRLDLPAEDAVGLWPGWWGYGDEAALVGHSLAIHRSTFWGAPCPFAGCGARSDVVKVFDLSDPDHPAEAATVTLTESSWSWGLAAFGDTLWLTHYEWSTADGQGRYFVDRIDLSDPAHPVRLDKVNVPGVFFAASPDGGRLYTLETFWDGTSATTWMHGLELLPGGRARLFGSSRLAGYPAGAAAGDGFVWAVGTEWSGSGVTSRLSSVNLASMTIAGEQVIDGNWVWLAKAAGGKLFLQAGWQDQGVLVYGLADPARPAPEGFFRTSGWVYDIVVGGGFAYLPSGPYGVPRIPLAP